MLRLQDQTGWNEIPQEEIQQVIQQSAPQSPQEVPQPPSTLKTEEHNPQFDEGQVERFREVTSDLKERGYSLEELMTAFEKLGLADSKTMAGVKQQIESLWDE